MTDTYTCSYCNGVFKTDWTDEEARAEAVQNFGQMANTEQAILCDECYKKFMKWFEQNSRTQ